MAKIDSILQPEEKTFLAGCMKSMIMASGSIDDAELEDLDKLYEELGFTDYERCLDIFEDEVQDTDTFWKRAETIQREEAQELILEVLYELSIQDGFASSGEAHLLQDLKEKWGVKEEILEEE